MTDKKIVYESRTKFILLLIVNWGFVIACTWTGYIWGLLFFGLCAVVTTYPLVDPRKRIIFIGTKEYKEQTDKDFNDRLVDNGIFRYTETGFAITLTDTKNIEWKKIQSIFAYKLDLMTTDEICIDIFCDDNISFRVTEETAGWFVFLERLKEQFPTVEEDWNVSITHPAFATNLTLLYDRENRIQEQVVRLFYSDDKKKKAS
ncbi:MAG: hypothetical protein IM631_20985 [Cytophagales bacterium]|nr:hypothetical protein [Cytophagales bacterium]MCA6373844.1 hypothetical protein [Cytophagales bacterium]MCA6376462.1 hypothetical protein [Cytophagales bacterium]MCA6385591.1 hypothetical protein [Cytophagales bacterium]